MSVLDSVINEIINDNYFKKNITFSKKISSKDASYADFPAGLHPDLKTALLKKDITKLYSHQFESYEKVTNNKNVVIVTPTASGKSLCYNLPVLQNLLNTDNTALYIFPTKALAQDQFNELIILDSTLKKNIYDGDTPNNSRKNIRNKSRIIITNPDMIHSGILPNHTKWVNFFEKLKYIIIDEMHIYKGVFGSHFANVLIRLKRISDFYKSKPQFILSSATIKNAEELAENLIGETVEVINKNGSPIGEKYFILYNPPIIDEEQNIRKSIIHETVKLSAEFIKKDISTIVFARSRLNVELIYQYLKNDNRIKSVSEKVKSYRGGYLPNERREIEKGLKTGLIKGVVSTNALELGVDIGTLEVSITAGYPGSISSVWQQAGRSGRKNDFSVSILIANNNPMDQFIIKNPDYFFGQPPESAIINPANVFILMSHIMCASFELPFLENEKFGNFNIKELLEYLEQEDLIKKSDDTFFWNGEDYPAETVSLRSTNSGTVSIINIDKDNTVIGEIDKSSAYMMLFKGAVYFHLGNQFEVVESDFNNNKAFVKEINAQYFTEPVVNSEIQILKIHKQTVENTFVKYFSKVAIRTIISQYKKIKFYTNEILSTGEVNIPTSEMSTYSAVLTFPEELFEALNNTDLIDDILRATASLLQNIIPLHILCDYHDIVAKAQRRSIYFNLPSIFIYDIFAGGMGLSEKVFDKIDDILNEIYKLVTECTCKYGCPSCIGPANQYKKDTKSETINFLKKVVKYD